MSMSPEVEAFRDKYAVPPSEMWSAHGTMCIKHRFVRKIAAKEGITVHLAIESIDQANDLCVFSASAEWNGIQMEEWGEASPKNNKNAYPVAMALKRAYDRVVLALLGIHGWVYSEDELAGSEELGATEGGERSPPGEDAIEKFLSNIISQYATDRATAEDLYKRNKGMIENLRKAAKARVLNQLKIISERGEAA
jgi:hypothetical protein